MNKSIIAVAMAASLAAATAVRAESHTIDLSLWSPTLQLQDPSDDVDAFRLAFYGKNHDVTGLDLGIWSIATGEVNGAQLGWLYSRTDGDFNGLQLGIVSLIRGEMYGADFGTVNIVKGKACGFMDGIYNQVNGEMKGMQYGWVNNANTLNGFQLGLVNYARCGYGLQIGFLNIFGDGFLPVFPIVNFNF